MDILKKHMEYMVKEINKMPSENKPLGYYSLILILTRYINILLNLAAEMMLVKKLTFQENEVNDLYKTIDSLLLFTIDSPKVLNESVKVEEALLLGWDRSICFLDKLQQIDGESRTKFVQKITSGFAIQPLINIGKGNFSLN